MATNQPTPPTPPTPPRSTNPTPATDIRYTRSQLRSVITDYVRNNQPDPQGLIDFCGSLNNKWAHKEMQALVLARVIKAHVKGNGIAADGTPNPPTIKYYMES